MQAGGDLGLNGQRKLGTFFLDCDSFQEPETSRPTISIPHPEDRVWHNPLEVRKMQSLWGYEKPLSSLGADFGPSYDSESSYYSNKSPYFYDFFEGSSGASDVTSLLSSISLSGSSESRRTSLSSSSGQGRGFVCGPDPIAEMFDVGENDSEGFGLKDVMGPEEPPLNFVEEREQCYDSTSSRSTKSSQRPKSRKTSTTLGDLEAFASKFGCASSPRTSVQYRPRKGKYRKEF